MLQTVENVEQASEHIAEWLAPAAQASIVLLASGGSSAAALAGAWHKLTKAQQQNITISLADERYGLVDHADSNWRLLKNLGIDLAEPRHIPVLTGKSMEATTIEWEQALRQYVQANTPIYAVLGIGADAHIAGIKPHSPAVEQTEALAICYPWEDYQRITITPAMFGHITSAIVYASGTAKKPVLEALQQDLDAATYPDQFIKQTGQYTIYYQP
jgi:6-phosphogluconolactonase